MKFFSLDFVNPFDLFASFKFSFLISMTLGLLAALSFVKALPWRVKPFQRIVQCFAGNNSAEPLSRANPKISFLLISLITLAFYLILPNGFDNQGEFIKPRLALIVTILSPFWLAEVRSIRAAKVCTTVLFGLILVNLLLICFQFKALNQELVEFNEGTGLLESNSIVLPLVSQKGIPETHQRLDQRLVITPSISP